MMTEQKKRPAYVEEKTLMPKSINRVCEFTLVNGTKVTGRLAKVTKFELLVDVKDEGFIVLYKHGVLMHRYVNPK